jgi:hypothetical protein
MRIAASAVPSAHLVSRADANSLQLILTQPGRGMIEKRLQELPPALRAQAQEAFAAFLIRARQAFSVSITETFLIAAALMGVALVVSLFLREIPPRRTHAEKPGVASLRTARNR